jgi:hypothetical protein
VLNFLPVGGGLAARLVARESMSVRERQEAEGGWLTG